MKKFITLVVCIAAVLALWTLVVRRYRFNVTMHEVYDRTARAAAMRAPAPLARLNVTALEQYRDSWFLDSQYYVLLGANYVYLRRPLDAVRNYELSVRREQRPETWVYLALAQREAGMHDAAVESFTRAARFSRSVATQIPDAQMAAEVVRRLDAEK